MNYKKLTAVFLASLLAVAALLPVFARDTGEDAGNGAPVAVNADYKTYMGIKLCGTLTAVDIENEACTFEIVKEPKKGALTLDNAAFEYLPFDGKTGKDAFTFIAIDESGNRSEAAKVQIEICKRAANDVFSYNDMEESPAHFASLYLRNEGIMVGETFGGESFFYPDKEVTRAQFVALTAAISEMTLPASSVGTGLSDNESIPSWARPYIAAAINCGVVLGERGEDGNKVFRAEDYITRAEAASVINRALKLADDGRELKVSDKEEIPSWAMQSVSNTNACGILPVFADNTVRAQSYVTREDAAQMLYAMLLMQQRSRAKEGTFLRLWK